MQKAFIIVGIQTEGLLAYVSFKNFWFRKGRMMGESIELCACLFLFISSKWTESDENRDFVPSDERDLFFWRGYPKFAHGCSELYCLIKRYG